MVYFIATINFDDAKDKKPYLDYMKLVQPIVNKYNGKYLVRSEKITSLGTKWSPNRVIIIEFETREELERCFSSKEYRNISSLREDFVDSNAIIIE